MNVKVCVCVFRKEVVMAIKEVEIVNTNSEKELEVEKRNSQSTVSGSMATQHG